MNETFMGLKGLGHECKQLTDKLCLPNNMFTLVSKGEIKQAIARISKTEMKEEMQNIRKAGDRWTDNPIKNTYLKDLFQNPLAGKNAQYLIHLLRKTPI